jgi:hypothetical protein
MSRRRAPPEPRSIPAKARRSWWLIAAAVVVGLALLVVGGYYAIQSTRPQVEGVTLSSVHLYNIYQSPANDSFGPTWTNLCAPGFCNATEPANGTLTVNLVETNGGGSVIVFHSVTANSTLFHVTVESPSSGTPFSVSPGSKETCVIAIRLPQSPGTYSLVITQTIS